jgi:hypothetical protein
MSLNAINDIQSDDFVVRNRDKKSHSNIYLKQAQKRDQNLADAINSLPNKLKKKLATDMPSSAKPTEARKADKRRTNSPTYNILAEYEEELLAEKDAMDEMAQVDFHQEGLIDIVFEKLQSDDEESIDGNVFMTHLNNLASLTRYYEKIAANPDEADPEYEFWLMFEIRAFEEDGSHNIVDVESCHYQKTDEDYEMDADDRMQQYIEDRAADAVDDRY